MDSSELIVITGPIASGKSTIGALVAEESDFQFFPEDVDTAPLDREILARYYRAVEVFDRVGGLDDRASRAAVEEARRDVYATQVHFIQKRSLILEQIVREGRRAVVERHPWDDIHVFSRRNLKYGLLTPEQFDSLRQRVETEIRGIPAPRAIVFLCAQPGSLRRRIANRAREQEKDLLSPGNPYLEEIAELYDSWYGDYGGEKIRVRTDGLGEEEVVSRIASGFRDRGIAMVRQET